MPKTGNDYLKSLLEPVEPKSLLSLVLAGYCSELLMTWAVERVNGVQNYSIAANTAKQADPEFLEFVSLMQDLQNEGAVGFEIKKDPQSNYDVIFLYRDKQFPQATLEKKKRVGEILKLEPNRDRYRVIYSPFQNSTDELAMQTRSVIQILVAMSGFVEVPDHVNQHGNRQ